MSFKKMIEKEKLDETSTTTTTIGTEQGLLQLGSQDRKSPASEWEELRWAPVGEQLVPFSSF